jgi:hypothetical protein
MLLTPLKPLHPHFLKKLHPLLFFFWLAIFPFGMPWLQIKIIQFLPSSSGSKILQNSHQATVTQKITALNRPTVAM